MDAHHSSRVSTAPAGRRSALREERHPNAVTAPPLHRGSMTPVPWRGFWNSLGTAVLLRLTGRTRAGAAALPAARPSQAWESAAQRRR